MGDRSLPPKVEGHPQGRLDLIFGRPAVFPPPQPCQSFIFTFRWWGDTQPCILRLPPEKSETRITHMVTCSPHSFRQYLSDMRNLHVTLKISGEGSAENSHHHHHNHHHHHEAVDHTRSPRRTEGETPRQKLLRRQQRLKKGWQDGDVVGSFILPDLKLNARGDYVHEARILDVSGDMIGSVVVTMVFLEGTLEDFQQIKTQSEEMVSPQPSVSPEKADNGLGKSRLSSIPVPESRLGKSQKTPTQEGGFRQRSWSFRESFRQKCDKLKSSKKQQQQPQQQQQQQQQEQQHSFEYSGIEKENQAPHRRRASSFTKTRGRDAPPPPQDKFPTVRRTSYHESHLQQPNHSQPAQEVVSVKCAEVTRQQDPSYGRAHEGRNAEAGRSPQLPRRAIPQKVAPKNAQVVGDTPPVVRRERKLQEGVSERARPASWGLYSLLNGAHPHSLVDSGAVKAEELPILLQVLEGHSPNLDLSNFDPKTQKLLDGLDLSLTAAGINGSSPGRFTFDTTKGLATQHQGQAFSVFRKVRQGDDERDAAGVTVSGVWPIDEGKQNRVEGLGHRPPTVVPKKVRGSENVKFDSPKKTLPVQSKIPMSHGGRIPVKAQRPLSARPGPEKKPFPAPNASAQPAREDEEAWMQVEKTTPEKQQPAEEEAVLVVDIGTLTLASPLLPPTPPEMRKKVTGVRVLHRSRVCYLTTLEVSLPSLEPPLEWDMSQTCASRQLVDHEVRYGVREVVRLPAVPVADILRGHLVIKCVCRRLGERENEEVGSSSISLLDLWQLNGSEVEVPLFSSTHTYVSRGGRKARIKEEEEEENKPHSFAHITLTTNLTFASGQGREGDEGTQKAESRQRSQGRTYAWNGEDESLKLRDERSYSGKFGERNSLATSMDSSSGSDLSESRYLLADSGLIGQHSQLVKPKIITPGYQKCQETAEFNSIYLPTHASPNDRTRRDATHYAGVPGMTGNGEGVSAPQFTPRHVEPGYQGYQSSFLSVIGEYNGSSNQPVESGGESPCITTASDYTADFIDYNALGWQHGEGGGRREDQRGCCRVHLEILKGRNLPWIEGSEGVPQPPNCYVRTNVGSLAVLTNVCRESVNPTWNFAADVLLPYGQLSQTNGSLILKVHHSHTHQRASPDDLLLGFVSVDATSIWGGHVSLCGWYPLLDLRGAIRGHVKVSLTPHEPPLNVAVSSMRQPVHPPAGYGPPASQHLPAQRHAHCSDRFAEPQVESMYFQGDGVCHSVLNSLVRTAGVLPHFTTKNQREIYNQNLQGVKDASSSSLEPDGKAMPRGPPEPSDPYGEKGEDAARDKSEECVVSGRGSAGDKAQNASRKTSSIPVFNSGKTGVKSPRPEEKGRIPGILPKIDYRDKENVQPTTEVTSQGYCRHKGSIVVKGLAKESGHNPQHPDPGPGVSGMSDHAHRHGLQKDGREASTAKDSIIVSHFRMQKERDEAGEELHGRAVLGSKPAAAQKAVMTSSSSDNSQSDGQHSQHSAADSRPTSQSANKPSSCLKAPGSPSLRVKHVTFAHKLVQHQNGDAKLQSHFSQGEASWRCPQGPQHPALTRQDALASRHLSGSHSLNLEGSDLQVVPCREGDPQAHSATAAAQGGPAVNGYGTSASLDRTKEDLIMAFSWMNNECDTPCVSFIESKLPLQNSIESNGTCSSKSPSDDSLSAPSPALGTSTSPKKSRKLRSRIAANFALK